jgi:sulfopyruvate decarboxylase TPP-binding subunit
MISPLQVKRLLAAASAAGIDWLLVVPSTGLGAVYEHFGARNRCMYLTREEEAVSVAAGLALGGAHPMVLIQQSGVGNALNAVFSLAEAYAIFFPIVVCDRGLNDVNPVQRVSSQRTRQVLDALGCVFLDLDDPISPTFFHHEVCEKGIRWLRCDL